MHSTLDSILRLRYPPPWIDTGVIKNARKLNWHLYPIWRSSGQDYLPIWDLQEIRRCAKLELLLQRDAGWIQRHCGTIEKDLKTSKLRLIKTSIKRKDLRRAIATAKKLEASSEQVSYKVLTGQEPNLARVRHSWSRKKGKRIKEDYVCFVTPHPGLRQTAKQKNSIHLPKTSAKVALEDLYPVVKHENAWVAKDLRREQLSPENRPGLPILGLGVQRLRSQGFSRYSKRRLPYRSQIEAVGWEAPLCYDLSNRTQSSAVLVTLKEIVGFATQWRWKTREAFEVLNLVKSLDEEDTGKVFLDHSLVRTNVSHEQWNPILPTEEEFDDWTLTDVRERLRLGRTGRKFYFEIERYALLENKDDPDTGLVTPCTLRGTTGYRWKVLLDDVTEDWSSSLRNFLRDTIWSIIGDEDSKASQDRWWNGKPRFLCPWSTASTTWVGSSSQWVNFFRPLLESWKIGKSKQRRSNLTTDRSKRLIDQILPADRHPNERRKPQAVRGKSPLIGLDKAGLVFANYCPDTWQREPRAALTEDRKNWLLLFERSAASFVSPILGELDFKNPWDWDEPDLSETPVTYPEGSESLSSRWICSTSSSRGPPLLN